MLDDVRDHSLRHRERRVIIASWVISSLGDFEDLDGAVIDVHREALGTAEEALTLGSRVLQLSAERLGKRARRISHHGDELVAFQALLLGPGCHHCTVIYTKYNDLVDPDGLESVRLLKIPRDLLCGSRGSEGAREAQKKNLLAHQPGRERNFLWGEAEVKVDVRQRLPNLEARYAQRQAGEG